MSTEFIFPSLQHPEAISSFVEACRDLLGDRVSTSPEDRLKAGKDWWPRAWLWDARGKVLSFPDVVVWPESTEEVVALVRLASQHRIPITPRGGGSGVLGGAVPVRGGVVMDLTRMRRIRELHEEDLLVTVEAGILGITLEEELNRQGFTCGHVPQSLALSTVGGWIAARSIGEFSTKYGPIEGMVAGLEVVLPWGEIWRTRVAPRTATGPGLMDLFVGAEGTLGIITAATLRIRRLPEMRRMRSFTFPDLAKGITAVREMIQRGVLPAVCRLYDEMEAAYRFSSVVRKGGPLLLLLFEGESRLVLAEDSVGTEICLDHGAQETGEEPMQHWLKTRFDVSEVEALLKQGAVLDTIEVAATYSRILPLYDAVVSAIQAVPGTVVAFGHFSHFYPDGACLYVSLAGFPGEDREGYHQRCWEAAMHACLARGGTISHHHGIGLQKAPWLGQELGEGLEILRRIKRAIDPHELFNPGKFGV
ncbi:MAG: FAD-binding oxidoreductase [Armatimonadota bacterium]|nr:FAD-binding oxidoreductase [Armatimonadota bacterium]